MMDWIKIVKDALDEDIGTGDVTTLCTIPENTIIEGRLLAKEDGMLAGLEVFTNAFQLLNKEILVNCKSKDGALVKDGQLVAVVKGPAQPILMAERVALNFLQRMSGIATLTHQMVKAVAGTKARILDTRKTVPGLRYFDKWAVRIGGGMNHRFGLFDMALIKENHIAAAGSITKAVNLIRQCNKKQLPIEVEVKNLEELQEALSLHVDRILLDNMDIPALKNAVALAQGKIPLEASGNVTLTTVKTIAETGVDYISAGSLTHSVKALDLSLLVE